MQVPVLDIHAVDHCNFHCRECNHASPRTPHQVHDARAYVPLMMRLSEFTRVDCICIVGGEPTLHPDLPGFIAALPWRSLADRVRLYTNGHWLLEESVPDTLIAAIRLVTEFYISLHPELVYRITPSQIVRTLLEIRQFAPSVRISVVPERTLILPVFDAVAEPRTHCNSHICLQLEPAGYLCRCPLIRFAAYFRETSKEFLDASRQADTRFYIQSGTRESFSLWYPAWPVACSYCRWGSFQAAHTSKFWSSTDIQQIVETLA